MDKEKFVTLDNEQIEEFNEYSRNLGMLKYALYSIIEHIENENSESINSICMLYIAYSYIENLKKNFTEFLKECDILL